MNKNFEILRQIDDAASQLGTMTVKNVDRGIKRSPMQTRKLNSEMLVDKNEKSPVYKFQNQLQGENLIKFSNRFDVTKTQWNKSPSPNDYNDDLRSMRSEYNYDKKKNFVDILGQKQIQSRQNGGYGLHQMAQGQQLINLDDDNRRDKHSGMNSTFQSPKGSSTKKRFNSVVKQRHDHMTQEPINEKEEMIDDHFQMPLTTYLSKQTLNANTDSKENLQIIDEDGNEYETLIELKNKQKQIYEQQQQQMREIDQQIQDYVQKKTHRGPNGFSEVANYKLNGKNPQKVNNNSSINIAAQFLFGGKNYDELKPNQQIRLFENLNNSSNLSFLTHRQNSIAENDKKALLTRKKMGMNQNHHVISKEFQELGFLSKNGRDQDYYAQDSSADFSSKLRTIQPKKHKDFKGFKSKGTDYQQRFFSPNQTKTTGQSKRIADMQELLRKTMTSPEQPLSPTARKPIKLHELRTHRNKSVNVSDRISKLPSGYHSPVQNDYELPTTQKILQKLATINLNGYNYNEPGSLTMAYRVPQNLVGQSLRAAHKQTCQINQDLLSQKQDSFNQTAPSSKGFSTNNPNFPRTTNQDFHNMNIWEKQMQINQKENKFNYKKTSEFSSYVDAMFNQGVYQKPTYDQL